MLLALRSFNIDFLTNKFYNYLLINKNNKQRVNMSAPLNNNEKPFLNFSQDLVNSNNSNSNLTDAKISANFLLFFRQFVHFFPEKQTVSTWKKAVAPSQNTLPSIYQNTINLKRTSLNPEANVLLKEKEKTNWKNVFKIREGIEKDLEDLEKEHSENVLLYRELFHILTIDLKNYREASEMPQTILKFQHHDQSINEASLWLKKNLTNIQKLRVARKEFLLKYEEAIEQAGQLHHKIKKDYIDQLPVIDGETQIVRCSAEQLIRAAKLARDSFPALMQAYSGDHELCELARLIQIILCGPEVRTYPLPKTQFCFDLIETSGRSIIRPLVMRSDSSYLYHVCSHFGRTSPMDAALDEELKINFFKITESVWKDFIQRPSYTLIVDGKIVPLGKEIAKKEQDLFFEILKGYKQFLKENPQQVKIIVQQAKESPLFKKAIKFFGADFFDFVKSAFPSVCLENILEHELQTHAHDWGKVLEHCQLDPETINEIAKNSGCEKKEIESLLRYKVVELLIVCNQKPLNEVYDANILHLLHDYMPEGAPMFPLLSTRNLKTKIVFSTFQLADYDSFIETRLMLNCQLDGISFNNENGVAVAALEYGIQSKNLHQVPSQTSIYIRSMFFSWNINQDLIDYFISKFTFSAQDYAHRFEAFFSNSTDFSKQFSKLYKKDSSGMSSFNPYKLKRQEREGYVSELFRLEESLKKQILELGRGNLRQTQFLKEALNLLIEIGDYQVFHERFVYLLKRESFTLDFFEKSFELFSQNKRALSILRQAHKIFKHIVNQTRDEIAKQKETLKKDEFYQWVFEGIKYDYNSKMVLCKPDQASFADHLFLKSYYRLAQCAFRPLEQIWCAKLAQSMGHSNQLDFSDHYEDTCVYQFPTSPLVLTGFMENSHLFIESIIRKNLGLKINDKELNEEQLKEGVKKLVRRFIKDLNEGVEIQINNLKTQACELIKGELDESQPFIIEEMHQSFVRALLACQTADKFKAMTESRMSQVILGLFPPSQKSKEYSEFPEEVLMDLFTFEEEKMPHILTKVIEYSRMDPVIIRELAKKFKCKESEIEGVVRKKALDLVLLVNTVSAYHMYNEVAGIFNSNKTHQCLIRRSPKKPLYVFNESFTSVKMSMEFQLNLPPKNDEELKQIGTCKEEFYISDINKSREEGTTYEMRLFDFRSAYQNPLAFHNYLYRTASNVSDLSVEEARDYVLKHVKGFLELKPEAKTLYSSEEEKRLEFLKKLVGELEYTTKSYAILLIQQNKTEKEVRQELFKLKQDIIKAVTDLKQVLSTHYSQFRDRLNKEINEVEKKEFERRQEIVNELENKFGTLLADIGILVTKFPPSEEERKQEQKRLSKRSTLS